MTEGEKEIIKELKKINNQLRTIDKTLKQIEGKPFLG